MKRATPVSLLAAWIALAAGLADAPKDAAKVPSAEEVAELLRKEPINVETWPAWSKRQREWVSDRTNQTDAAFRAAHEFLRAQANKEGQLPAELADDPFAWYLLASTYLDPARSQPQLAEAALRRSLTLDPNFARAHRNLASALLLQAKPGERATEARQREAEKALAEARRLDPGLSLSWIEAEVALRHKRLFDAEKLYRHALAEDPKNLGFARGLAWSIVLNKDRKEKGAPHIRPLVERFPNDGTLVCLYAHALHRDRADPEEVMQQLERTVGLGTNPLEVLDADTFREMMEAGLAAEEPDDRDLYQRIALFGGIALALAILVWLAVRWRSARVAQPESVPPEQGEVDPASGSGEN